MIGIRRYRLLSGIAAALVLCLALPLPLPLAAAGAGPELALETIGGRVGQPNHPAHFVRWLPGRAVGYSSAGPCLPGGAVRPDAYV